VRSKQAPDRVILEFEDSGPGVPTEMRERIFEPFFTTKPPGAGNGLGLSTAREIVLQHGGSLGIHEAGGRTVFRVELPIAG
jgi:signal transduction histidine kinase